MPAGDITKIEAGSIPDFNILCAGFPCQPFSIAGKQRGFKDTRGTLFFEIMRIVKAKKPEVIFLENVENLVRHDDGNTLRVILDTLEGLGYDVHYQVLNAAHYGVAQIRKRIYFVCFRKDLQVDFSFPKPTFEDVAVEDYLEDTLPMYVRATAENASVALGTADALFGGVQQLSRKDAPRNELAFVTKEMKERDIREKLEQLSKMGVKVETTVRVADL